MVMLLLVLASVVSWVIIFQRANIFKQADKLSVSFEGRCWSGMVLSQLSREIKAGPRGAGGWESISRAGCKEFNRLRQQEGVDRDAVMEGTSRAMRVAVSRENEKRNTKLSF